MNINPLSLHFAGLIVDERLNELSSNEERIIEVLHRVDFEDYDDLLVAAEKLQDVDGSEVINCIAEYWRPEYYLDGLENLEKVFQAEIDLDKAIGNYFADNEHWDFDNDDSEWLKEFNERYGHNITADDVTRNISISYLISNTYGPGLCGFWRFVVSNDGDPELFIGKVFSEANRLSQTVDSEEFQQLEVFFESYAPELMLQISA